MIRLRLRGKRSAAPSAPAGAIHAAALVSSSSAGPAAAGPGGPLVAAGDSAAPPKKRGRIRLPSRSGTQPRKKVTSGSSGYKKCQQQKDAAEAAFKEERAAREDADQRAAQALQLLEQASLSAEDGAAFAAEARPRLARAEAAAAEARQAERRAIAEIDAQERAHLRWMEIHGVPFPARQAGTGAWTYPNTPQEWEAAREAVRRRLARAAARRSPPRSPSPPRRGR